MTEHNWSGWPGAFCLNCHTEDPIENCIGTCNAQPADEIGYPDPIRCPVHAEEIQWQLASCPPRPFKEWKMHTKECGGKCLAHLKPGETYVGDVPCTVNQGSSTITVMLPSLERIQTPTHIPGVKDREREADRNKPVQCEEHDGRHPFSPEDCRGAVHDDPSEKAAFLRPEVEIFARAMEIRLRQKDDERCGNSWQTGADVKHLLEYLQKQVTDLSYALHVSAADGKTLVEIGTNVLARAADVANLALIVADWFGATGNIEHLEAEARVTHEVPPR